MEPGTLRKRLTFFSKSGTPNSFGEVTGWTDYYTCWGSVKILKAQMIYSTGEFIGKETYDVRIRYTATQSFNVENTFTTEDGTVFQIDSVMNVNMANKEIQILAHVINQVVN